MILSWPVGCGSRGMGCAFLRGLGVGFLGASDINVAAVGAELHGYGLGSIPMQWPSVQGCILLHL